MPGSKPLPGRYPCPNTPEIISEISLSLSVRDRGVGGSNPLAPTNFLRKFAKFSLPNHSVPRQDSRLGTECSVLQIPPSSRIVRDFSPPSRSRPANPARFPRQIATLDATRGLGGPRFTKLTIDRLIAVVRTMTSSPHGSRRVNSVDQSPGLVHQLSSSDEKIALFRSLFRGREDVYPRRFESRKTGKSGYAPACANEWVRGICEKPRIKCAECPQPSLPAGHG